MTASLPRFRRDLIISRQASDEAAVVVVKDPVKGRFYRLPEEAHFIADQLDGATPLDAVRERAEKQFGAQVSAEQLGAFIRQLDQSGLLESPRRRGPKPPRRIQGSVLYLRFRFFDPDRLFNRLIPWIRFFFTPAFVALAAAAIAFAACVLAAHWNDLIRDFPRIYQPAIIPLFFAVGFLVVSAHEFAHGLTCKYFGGQVHELGFVLIYFQPAFYCNVSDAWLFPEKSRRLWVGFAGPFFELFLWAVAVFLWRATDPEAWLNQAAFVVLTTSGVKTLLNFNPLIKLDGYYLLSDWLAIPNLRRRAFAAAGDLIKKLFRRPAERLAELSPRERRILLTYGVTATIGSIAILALAVTKLGGYLIQNNQPLAFILFAGMLGQKVRRRFRYLFGQSTDPADDDDDNDSAPASAAVVQASDPPVTAPAPVAQASGPPAPVPAAVPQAPDPPVTALATVPKAAGPPMPAPAGSVAGTSKRAAASRVYKFVKRLLAFTVVGGATAVVMIYVQGQLRISGPFDTLPIRNADVRAATDGLISEILVDEGALVHKGDLIARLSDVDLRAQLAQTEGQIAEDQAKLELLQNGPRPQEIQAARVAVAKSQSDVKYAQLRLDRDRLLFNSLLEAQQIVEDSEAKLADQQQALAAAKAQLALLEAGSRPEDIAAAKAQIATLSAQRDYIQTQLHLLNIYSPDDGVVATPSRELHDLDHQFVKKGDLIAKVFDLKTITAEIPVSERDIADVHIGQPVELKVRAYPALTFHGTVTAIAVMAQPAPGSGSGSSSLLSPLTSSTSAAAPSVAPKTFLVTTTIDNPQLLLKPEMTGQAKILCGRRSLFELTARQVARTFNVALWSWW